MTCDTALTARPRRPDDLSRVVAWVPDAAALARFSGSRLPWPLTADAITDLTADAGLLPFAVTDGFGDLVGHFDLAFAGTLAHLGRVLIAPARRGQGLAQRLIALVLAEAQARGARRVRLNVAVENEAALRAYRRAGFLAQPTTDGRTDIVTLEWAAPIDGPTARVLVTGMSGTGKSTLLRALAERGWRTLDTDYDGWVLPDGRWDEPRMASLLAAERRIIVQGAVENQGGFFDRFEHVVLLSAPVEVLLERVRARTENPYGSTPADREEIRRNVREVEPLLRASCDLELDAQHPTAELADAIEALCR